MSRTREREWAPPLVILIPLPSPPLGKKKKHKKVFDTDLIRPAAVAGSEGLGKREPILIGSLHCTGVNIYLNRRTFGIVSINSALEY